MWTVTSACRKALAALLAASLAVACAGGPTSEPARLRQENALAARAAAALAKGRHDRAAALYEEALEKARSIEHTEGIGSSLVNLAAVYRSLGLPTRAREAVEEVLGQRDLSYSPSLRAEAAFVGALLYMDEGDYGAAAGGAGDAMGFCLEGPCPERGKILNLQARLAALEGRHDDAMERIAEALPLNRRGGDRRETANSLRTMADVSLARGRAGEAEKLYREALAVDKELGLSSKIASDLIGIAGALEVEGRTAEAGSFYARALQVSRAAGDPASEALAAAGLERTGRGLPP